VGRSRQPALHVIGDGRTVSEWEGGLTWLESKQRAWTGQDGPEEVYSGYYNAKGKKVRKQGG